MFGKNRLGGRPVTHYHVCDTRLAAKSRNAQKRRIRTSGPKAQPSGDLRFPA